MQVSRSHDVGCEAHGGLIAHRYEDRTGVSPLSEVHRCCIQSAAVDWPRLVCAGGSGKEQWGEKRTRDKGSADHRAPAPRGRRMKRNLGLSTSLVTSLSWRGQSPRLPARQIGMPGTASAECRWLYILYSPAREDARDYYRLIDLKRPYLVSMNVITLLTASSTIGVVAATRPAWEGIAILPVQDIVVYIIEVHCLAT